jgi:transposase
MKLKSLFILTWMGLSGYAENYNSRIADTKLKQFLLSPHNKHLLTNKNFHFSNRTPKLKRGIIYHHKTLFRVVIIKFSHRIPSLKLEERRSN